MKMKCKKFVKKDALRVQKVKNRVAGYRGQLLSSEGYGEAK